MVDYVDADNTKQGSQCITRLGTMYVVALVDGRWVLALVYPGT